MPYKDREKLYAAQKRYRIKIRGKLFNFLSEKECIDCGEKDPIVLDFDHIDKNKNLSLYHRCCVDIILGNH
jgi:hypothetical protein